jgi:hypothetical protein
MVIALLVYYKYGISYNITALGQALLGAIWDFVESALSAFVEFRVENASFWLDRGFHYMQTNCDALDGINR